MPNWTRRAAPGITLLASMILASCATIATTPAPGREPVTAAACGAFQRQTFAAGQWPPEKALSEARAALGGAGQGCEGQACKPVLDRLWAALGDTPGTRVQIKAHNAVGRVLCPGWDGPPKDQNRAP